MSKVIYFLTEYIKSPKTFLNKLKSEEQKKKKVDTTEYFDLQNIEIDYDGLSVRGDIIYYWDCINHYENIEKNPRKLLFSRMMEQKLLLLAKLKDVEINIGKLLDNDLLSPMDKYYRLKEHINKKFEICGKKELNEMKLDLYKTYKDMDYDPDDAETQPKDVID